MNTLTKKICAIAVVGAFSATAQANGLQNSGDLPNIPLVPIETMSNLPKLPADIGCGRDSLGNAAGGERFSRCRSGSVWADQHHGNAGLISSRPLLSVT